MSRPDSGAAPITGAPDDAALAAGAPNDGGTPVGAGAPDLLLSAAVGLLPEGRRYWGRAMRAELASVEPGPARWRFSLSCVRATLANPLAAFTLARRLLWLGVLVTTVLIAMNISFGYLRGEALLMVAALGGVAWLARSSWAFGPAAPDRVARALRTGGFALIAAHVVIGINQMRVSPPIYVDYTPRVADATTEVIVVSTILTIYLVALARVTARGSDIAASTVTAGAGVGVLGALLWTAATMIFPSLPDAMGPALLTVLAAAVTAGVWTARRSGVRQAIVATLCAATTAAPSIDLIIEHLLPLPGHWVGNSHPPVYPATSVDRLVDPIGIMIVGCLCALALALAIRRRQTA